MKQEGGWDLDSYVSVLTLAQRWDVHPHTIIRQLRAARIEPSYRLGDVEQYVLDNTPPSISERSPALEQEA